MKRFLYIQVSDVLCYKLIPIIYRTSLLKNSLKVIMIKKITVNSKVIMVLEGGRDDSEKYFKHNII